jgi:anaerobic sulfite reductase subunit A
MGTNRAVAYDLYIDPLEAGYGIDCKRPEWASLFDDCPKERREVVPAFVENTASQGVVLCVVVPETLRSAIVVAPFWDEYDRRCINCGRCTFVCPTYTYYSMQDIFYQDNPKAGNAAEYGPLAWWTATDKKQPKDAAQGIP